MDRSADALRIREINLKPFRNFEHKCLLLDADQVLISGANGLGKSNILEAISYLSIEKSVRGSRDHTAIPHGGEFFDIEARCDDGISERALRIFFAKGAGKKSFCDQSPMSRVSDLLGVLLTVHFAPEDVSLVLRFPAERRRALDILISQASTGYLSDLQQYNKVLAHRNRALRLVGRESRDGNEVEVWNGQFCKFGGRIRQQRLEALSQLSTPYRLAYGRFSPASEVADIRYDGPLSAGVGQGDFLQQQLAEMRGAERRQGHTVCGPHRDDLVFTLNGEAAHEFASEGQLKTVLIAWKMAEFEFLANARGKKPVLLLDDLFSELDEERVERLLDHMDAFEQVLLTTPNQLDRSIRGRFSEIRLAS